MKANVNYPYLLAVHMVCADGQLHQKEHLGLKSLAEEFRIDDATQAAADAILSQADEHISLNAIIRNTPLPLRSQALYMASLASLLDDVVDRTEEQMLEGVISSWQFDPNDFAKIKKDARHHALNMQGTKHQVERENISTGAKIYKGLENVLGQRLLDQVVKGLGSESLKERVDNFRIEALLSGPEYDKAIEECRIVGLRDIEVADNSLAAATNALNNVREMLERMLSHLETKAGDKPAQDTREIIRSLKEDNAQIGKMIDLELLNIKEVQIKKRRAMNYYTIAFMGRSKAGKSTLHAVVTGGGWDQIGVGLLNTTRLNRVYEWNSIRIIDTPGIAAPGGEDLQRVAESIIDEADLVCFVVTTDNQKPPEFEFLKQLREKGKPILVLLNVKEEINHPVRLKRFLANPDRPFSNDADRLGGHLVRIRRDAEKHYGTSKFPIVPVHLLAG
ncbi:MAG: hypothetical protein RLZZ298_2519 [Pseudomonadota bacterium]|jgi:GTP-binding protein EngB required for normal cell division